MSEYKTLRSLLEFHVQQLRLKPDACWPSEAASTKEMIRRWQRENKVKDYGSVYHDDGDWTSSDPDGSSVVGEQ